MSQISTATNLTNKTVINSLKVLEQKKIISTKKRHNRTTKIKLLIGGAKMGTPIPKMGTQLYPKVNTQNTIQNTYRENQVLGGLMTMDD